MADLIPIASIRRDGGTQPRATLNLNWVEEYGQDMIAGAEFPPVVAFYDGSIYWLADGFHRTEAAIAVGLAEIAADIRQGTQRDAILYSVSANGTHGQRRTNEDKRRAVLTLLDDPEWSKWSDHEIARRCVVDHKVVSRLRPPPVDTGAKPQPETRVFIHPKTGQPTTMRTGGINAGRSAASPAKTPSPPEMRAPRVDRSPESIPADHCRHEEVEDCASELCPLVEDVGDAAAEAPEPMPEFDRAAADLHRQIMVAVATFGTIEATPREAMDACNKHSGRGVLPSVVNQAASWLKDFAVLYEVEEPIRAQTVQEIFGAAA